MAGTTSRLKIWFVLCNILPVAWLQRPSSLIHNPFRLSLDLRKEIRERTQNFLHYSPTSSVISIEDPSFLHTFRNQRSFPDKNSQRSFRKIARKTRNSLQGSRTVGNSQSYDISSIHTNSNHNDSSASKTQIVNRIYSLKNISTFKNQPNYINNIYNYQDVYQKKQNDLRNFSKYPNKFKYKPLVQSPYKSLHKNTSKGLRGGAENDIRNDITQRYNRRKISASKHGNSTQPMNKADDKPKASLLGFVISTLTRLPIIGNVLRASVDPLYRPIIRGLQADNETIMRGENDMGNWCFGELGCIKPSMDFYHPLYRPVNLPPYPRDKIATTFTVHSRQDPDGHEVPAMNITEIFNSTFHASRPTKLIIHGYMNYKRVTWILEMVRGLLKHGDYNVITVDWSGGSYALYSQATANIRVVALEVSRLLNWLRRNFGLQMSSVHIIGHSLGSHTAGYVGEQIGGVGRITGLDPAEPFFQYMPESVRLDPSDAGFVDVIHTDINPFFALTGMTINGPRGFGLQQPVGHVDFYPNGGKEQPGCNQLLARVPMTLIMEGRDIIEGMNAAHTELLNCDHVRSTKLFTDSLVSDCPYLGFGCPSYEEYKQGKCFECGNSGERCAFMGINADKLFDGNQTNVRFFLDTNVSPHFCKYHYILTIAFADPEVSVGTLRGRLQISLIDEDGNLQKFDLTSMSPMKFPRQGTKTFLLDHYQDLSGSQEALIHWVFESDILDPLSYCVLFCKADLFVSSVSIRSVNSKIASRRLLRVHSGLAERAWKGGWSSEEMVMCHKKGEDVVPIASDKTVKISASASCPRIRRVKSARVRKEQPTKILH